MKHIVITGTSRGMGYEMVKIFAEKGHKILALSRNDKPISELGLENVTAIPCDLSKAEDLAKVSAYISEKWKQVDVLINNAGALINKPFEEISSEEFQKIYSTNVFGVIGLTQKLLPFMKKESHVVNISTMGGVQGSVKFPGLSAYSSSKAAVITLTELLAEEYKENGPSFNVLALGAVQTEMLEEAFPGLEVPLSAKDWRPILQILALPGINFIMVNCFRYLTVHRSQ